MDEKTLAAMLAETQQPQQKRSPLADFLMSEKDQRPYWETQHRGMVLPLVQSGYNNSVSYGVPGVLGGQGWSTMNDIVSGRSVTPDEIGHAAGDVAGAAMTGSFAGVRPSGAVGSGGMKTASEKAIPQAKGTPEQMLAALKKAGVKDAEIEATGLRQWLAEKSAAPEIRTAYKVNGTVYDLPGLATHTDVMGSAIDKMGFKTAAESNKWIGTAETQSGFTVGGKFIGKAEAAEKLGMAPYELDSQSQNVSRLLELFPMANYLMSGM